MLSIRLNAQAEEELKEIAKFHGISVSDYVRGLINEKLEDMFDLQLANDALSAYQNDPTTFTLAEAEKELGL